MSGIRPKRAPRRREAPQETDAAWWEAATHSLAVRASLGSRDGRPVCERGCGRPLDVTGALRGIRAERHHRQRRRDGGDRLANLMLLCHLCHRYVTEHPDEAKANGLIVPPETDPATVPVRMADGYLYLLDDVGGRRLVP